MPPGVVKSPVMISPNRKAGPKIKNNDHQESVTQSSSREEEDRSITELQNFAENLEDCLTANV